MEDMSKWQIINERPLSARCQQYAGPLTAGILAVAAFLSPILMVVLPQLGVFDSKSRNVLQLKRFELRMKVFFDGI